MNKQCHCYEDVIPPPSIDPECISDGLLQLLGQLFHLDNGIVFGQNCLSRDAVFLLEVQYICLNTNQFFFGCPYLHAPDSVLIVNFICCIHINGLLCMCSYIHCLLDLIVVDVSTDHCRLEYVK
jgi:hypothetical protein